MQDWSWPYVAVAASKPSHINKSYSDNNPAGKSNSPSLLFRGHYNPSSIHSSLYSAREPQTLLQAGNWAKNYISVFPPAVHIYLQTKRKVNKIKGLSKSSNKKSHSSCTFFLASAKGDFYVLHSNKNGPKHLIRKLGSAAMGIMAPEFFRYIVHKDWWGPVSYGSTALRRAETPFCL